MRGSGPRNGLGMASAVRRGATVRRAEGDSTSSDTFHSEDGVDRPWHGNRDGHGDNTSGPVDQGQISIESRFGLATSRLRHSVTERDETVTGMQNPPHGRHPDPGEGGAGLLHSEEGTTASTTTPTRLRPPGVGSSTLRKRSYPSQSQMLRHL